MRVALRASLLVAAVAVVAAGAQACSDINNHLLEGQQYYAPGQCLSPQEVVDDLPGGDPGDNCTPECLVVPAQGGSPQTVYITTTCPPYPGYGTPELPDAAKDAADPCVGAFAAYYADGGDICTSFEGGIEAGADAADGAGKTDAGDATAEASAEASADASDAGAGD